FFSCIHEERKYSSSFCLARLQLHFRNTVTRLEFNEKIKVKPYSRLLLKVLKSLQIFRLMTAMDHL
ncbi:hypothetical protein IRJ41_018740, partial [Triplophysa rosa]